MELDSTAEFLGRGWSFPPRVDPATGRFAVCSGEEDIRQSIWIILMTRLGERQMLPNFGSSLHNYVFELPDASS
ncbi:MAG: GPW/gp25 family protein, partial [Oscillospiraceae bacterium]|nr:GPW/gp25 family protein [Oscillospiraceae bacterium]